MCRKAEEIQGARCYKWEPGDFWFKDYGNNDGEVNVLGNNGDYRHGRRGGVWLPRQDQLQEILIDSDCKGFVCEKARNIDFFEWATEYSKYYDKMLVYKKFILVYFKTIEQMWLAFVMHEKYGKLWNGQEWIVKGEG